MLHLVEESQDFWRTCFRHLLRFGALRRSFFGGSFRHFSVRELPKTTWMEFLGDSYAGVSTTGRASFLIFTASLHSELFMVIMDHLVTPFSMAEF